MTLAQSRIEKAKELAEFCIRCADDKKAEDPALIKLPETSGVADFFVVVTANSDPHLQALANHIERQVRETDPSLTMEGLYIKVEADGVVKDRMKYVRNSFYQCVNESGSHWQQRPIIPNQLAKKNGEYQ